LPVGIQQNAQALILGGILGQALGRQLARNKEGKLRAAGKLERLLAVLVAQARECFRARVGK
jgi:hypothetical protein